MEEKERFKIIEHMMKTMTPEELYDFMYDLSSTYYRHRNFSFNDSFNKVVEERK